MGVTSASLTYISFYIVYLSSRLVPFLLSFPFSESTKSRSAYPANMAEQNGSTTPRKPNILVRNLSYKFPDGSSGLQNVSLDLPAGSRTLLIGSNGAGKTTLLRLLSGKRMAPHGTVHIAGVDPFADGLEGVTYLGLEWVLNPIVRTDIAVPVLLDSVGGSHYAARRDELVRVLDIDLRWRMHAVSDGERRRVQLAMGLIRPWDVLLLDEITVDLDLLSRSNFLNWLREETDRRGATIVYATHILDNLVGWPSHLVHMAQGKVKEWGEMEKYEGESQEEGYGRTGNSKLGELVLRWLKEDLDERGPRDMMGQGKTYGASEEIGGYGLEKRPK
jgi:CCR4-NOT complex subunit CAF16